MINFKNKKIVIIGLGLTGISCIKFFLSKGIIPKAMDSRNKCFFNNLKIPKNIKLHFGSLNSQWIKKSDFIIISPGVSSFHPLIQMAIKLKKNIINDIDLFFFESNAPIIAITGSNGKSTVTTLLGNIIKKTGFSVGIGGNIGYPALYLLNNLSQFYILELSSFQLETTKYLVPYVAVILNITENHTDRYPLGFRQYYLTKLKIFDNTNICIINFNNLLKINKFIKNKFYITFGEKNNNDYHFINDKNNLWLGIKNNKVFKIKDLHIFGKHNYINMLATLALSDAINIPKKYSLKALREFHGLSHRLELIYESKGIRWINDSKSTNVNSTKAAIKSIHINNTNTLWLLLGGQAKSKNFNSLVPYLKKNMKIYCYGKDKNTLYNIYPNISKKVNSIKEALQKIIKYVKYGDVILLSPACASYDQFKNFEERGNTFKKLVKNLYK